MSRLIAFLLLAIPAIICAYGIKLMRDTLFSKLLEPYPYYWLQFIIGFFLFICCFFYFAGFLLHKDRKNGRLSKKIELKLQRKSKSSK